MGDPLTVTIIHAAKPSAWRYVTLSLAGIVFIAFLAYLTSRIIPGVVAAATLILLMKRQQAATLTIAADGVSLKMGRGNIAYKWADVARFQVSQSVAPVIGVVLSPDYRGGSELRRAALRRLWGVDAVLGGNWELPALTLVNQLNSARDTWAASAPVRAAPTASFKSETEASAPPALARPMVGELLGILARIVSWADVFAAFVAAAGITAAAQEGNLGGVLATTGFFALCVFNCLVLRKALRKNPETLAHLETDSAIAAPDNLVSTTQRAIGFFGNGFTIVFFAVYSPFLAIQGYAGIARMSLMFIALALVNFYLIATAGRSAD